MSEHLLRSLEQSKPSSVVSLFETLKSQQQQSSGETLALQHLQLEYLEKWAKDDQIVDFFFEMKQT